MPDATDPPVMSGLDAICPSTNIARRNPIVLGKMARVTLGHDGSGEVGGK
jgi:hypothetical protein